MKVRSQRQLRVGEELRHALAELLRDNDLRDPLLRDTSITVTEVRVSPDLKNATAYVMPLGGVVGVEGASVADVIRALNKAAAYFRGNLGRLLRLRYAPNIAFRIDDSFDEAGRIDALIARNRAEVTHGEDDTPDIAMDDEPEGED